MTASPIATQETVEEIAQRRMLEDVSPLPWAWNTKQSGEWDQRGPVLESVPLAAVWNQYWDSLPKDASTKDPPPSPEVVAGWGYDAWGLTVSEADAALIVDAVNSYDALRKALSSAERRNEELVRERDEANEFRDKACEAYLIEQRLREAAESALASLTGQVGEMRKAIDRARQEALEEGARLFDLWTEVSSGTPDRSLAFSDAAKALRSLALAPGREDDAPLATTPPPTLDGAERR